MFCFCFYFLFFNNSFNFWLKPISKTMNSKQEVVITSGSSSAKVALRILIYVPTSSMEFLEKNSIFVKGDIISGTVSICVIYQRLRNLKSSFNFE